MLRKGMFIGDRYEVISHIGRGGMADVYKGKDHKLNRYVAIKVLKEEFRGDKNFVAKFRVEAQAAARLAHPNVVNVYDVGDEDGVNYIIMELVEGITLKNYIERKGKLTVRETTSIAIQVAMGIEAAHNLNIVHRDIKPQNIIISREGKVKVTDFGIAKMASANTISSVTMGSVHYTSPEQARGGYSDAKSDIYSLGIVMYEMITGRVPFEGETPVTVAVKHLQEEMVPPHVYASDIPVSLEDIILKCTQKSQERRYANMSELLKDLKQSLVTPDASFVKFISPDETGKTVMFTKNDMNVIKQGAAAAAGAAAGTAAAARGRKPVYVDEDADSDYEDDYDGDGRYSGDYDGGDYDDGYGDGDRYEDDYDDGYDDGGRYEDDYDDGYDDDGRYEDDYDDGYGDGGRYEDDYDDGYDDDGRYEDDYEDDYDDGYEDDYEDDYDSRGRYDDDYDDGKDYGSRRGRRQESRSARDGYREGRSSKNAGGGKGSGRKSKQGKSYDDDEEGGLNPKMERIMFIGGIVVAVIIVCIILFMVGRALGLIGRSAAELQEDGTAQEVQEVEMPQLVGEQYEKAQAALSALGLDIRAAYEESDDYEEGEVMRQSVDAGEMVKTGTTVDVTVCSGQESFSLPSMDGKEQSAAEAALRDLGLKTATEQAYDDEVPAGRVISTNPVSGSEVIEGQTVTLIISRGAEVHTGTVPDLYNMLEADARAALQAAGFNVGSVTQSTSDSVVEGRVISQSVNANTVLEQGRSIDFVVSSGQDTVTVPNVTGALFDDAYESLTALGFRIEEEEVENSAPEGQIVSQSPRGNTEAARGATITLQVSAGPAESDTGNTGGTNTGGSTGTGTNGGQQNPAGGTGTGGNAQ